MTSQLFPEKLQTLIHNRILSGGIWAVGGKVMVLPLGLLISALLARVMSPTDMGTYIFAQSIVLSGVVLAQLGLGPTAVRTIAASLGTNDLASVRDSVRNLLYWGLAGAFITALVMNLFSDFIGIGSNIVFWISLWVIVLASQKLLAEILRGFHDIRAAALIGDASTGGLISYVIATITLFIVWRFYGQIGLSTALVITVIAGAIAVTWAFAILAKTLKTFNLPKEKRRNPFSWRFLYVTLPVLVHSLATQLQNQSGIWMLEAFQSSPEVALYGVSARLVALITVPLSVVNSVISPVIPELFWQGKTEKLERILQGLTTLSTIPAVLILIIFWAAGPFLMEQLYGEFYRAANDILIILTIGVVFNVMAGSSGLTLIMTGHQNTLMRISIFTGFLTLSAVYLVADRFGAIGVASVVSATLFLKNVLMVFFNKYLTGMWTHATLRIDRHTISALLN